MVTNECHVTNVKWYQRPPKTGINKEKSSRRNFCFPYETRISDQRIYKTTWILLKAEEEQENNEGHSLYRPTLLLQLSLSASSYTNGLSQTTALSCILWFLTMTLSFSKLFHWRLVFNCLISTLCLPTLSYTTGSPSTSTFVLFSVNCDSWLWLKAHVD